MYAIVAVVETRDPYTAGHQLRYPQGLPGDQILLESRIMAVADVVEAIASHRPYRPARGIDTALDEISKNRGILYDPVVTDACLTLFREKGYGFE